MKEFSSNQRVGLLSGLALFLGSLVTAYYSNARLWAWVTFVGLVTIVWLQSRVNHRESGYLVARAGFVIGASAVAIARILGWFSTRLITGTWRPEPVAEYEVLNGDITDLNQVVLNGTFADSLTLVLVLGLFCAFVAVSSVWAFNQTRQRRSS